MERDLGQKIKELRTSKNLTLKDLSQRTNLSIGYISQLERGLTSVAVSSLDSIAKALGVELSYFFSVFKQNNRRITRSYEQQVSLIENPRFIYYNLSNDAECESFSSFLIDVLPVQSHEDVVPYSHEGEEFIYVMEGILTIYIGDERHELYPGDCAHVNSNTPHNWCNHTNKIVKILAINSPINTPKIKNISKSRENIEREY